MINKSAILHIPMSQYAFAQGEHVLTVRLRASRGDLETCTLYWGDRACPESPVCFEKTEMAVCWRDELFDYYETTLEHSPQRVCYYFKLVKGAEWYFYYADEFHQSGPDRILEDGFVVEGRSEYYQYPFILRSEILQIPEWFRHCAVYNIFPDSFADGKRSIKGKEKTVVEKNGQTYRTKCGGTIAGIRENLDYIQDLGFDCLYLNPVFKAGEYHKYDIVDYFHIDPCLGTDEEFRELSDEVHRRGMRLIIDGVFNHCSRHFPYFEDVMQKGEKSRYKDWFYHIDFPLAHGKDENKRPGYTCFAYEPSMPKLNTANPRVQEYFAKVGSYWVEQYRIDGWRLDVANEVDRNFWRCFRKAVKASNPEAVLIGEVWENAQQWLKGDMLDSTMNYDFRKHCRRFFADGEIRAGQFAAVMTDMQLRYPIQMTRGQLNLLDSHDVSRFLSLCGEDRDRWRQALLYLCMAPGVPGIFCGDEMEITGFREPEYRKAMPWREEHKETQAFVKALLRIRRDWVGPDDTWHIIEADSARNLLVWERRGTHVVRVIQYMGEGLAEVEQYHADARLLLEKGTRGTCLEKYGYQILLIR